MKNMPEGALRAVYLLRHARPVGADEHRCLGSRSDPPLSPEGLAAARAMAETFVALDIRAVATSPLTRCVQTAAALFPHLPAKPLPGLAELDCGDWDGLTFDDIRARWPEHYARRGADPSLPPPGGETLAHAAARAEAALRSFLAGTEGNVAVVAHDGVNRALLCALTAADFARYRDFPQPYLCVDLLYFDGETLRLDAVLERMIDP